MAEISKRFDSKTGRWVSDPNGLAITNDNPTEKNATKGDVEDAYLKYLRNAQGDDGDYDFTEWNAKKLIWELGNQRSLPAVRNIMSKFQQLADCNLMTLSSGPRVTVNKEAQKAAAKGKFARLNLADLCRD